MNPARLASRRVSPVEALAEVFGLCNTVDILGIYPAAKGRRRLAPPFEVLHHQAPPASATPATTHSQGNAFFFSPGPTTDPSITIGSSVMVRVRRGAGAPMPARITRASE
jgi:hypothetical protein